MMTLLQKSCYLKNKMAKQKKKKRKKNLNLRMKRVETCKAFHLQSIGDKEVLLLPSRTKEGADLAILSEQSQLWKVLTKLRLEF